MSEWMDTLLHSVTQRVISCSPNWNKPVNQFSDTDLKHNEGFSFTVSSETENVN